MYQFMNLNLLLGVHSACMLVCVWCCAGDIMADRCLLKWVGVGLLT